MELESMLKSLTSSTYNVIYADLKYFPHFELSFI